ncbi:unnamed protein product, partial [Tetraodon nigroviridis]
THRRRHRSKLLISRLGQLLLLQHESRSHEETTAEHLLLQVHVTHARRVCVCVCVCVCAARQVS